jgi:protein pelota
MKILKKNISFKDGSGSIMLRPETTEDLWHTYNLLRKDDLVRCTTVRKIVKESNTGSTTSSKKRMMLTIRIKKIDFDPDSDEVRISGIVESENDKGVRLGAHHTLKIKPYQNFTLEKVCWDQIYLEILDDSCNPTANSELAAVVMHMGLAHVCLITGSLTVTKARIETNIPKKRTGSSNNSKGIKKFFDAVYQALLRHIDFNKIKAILIGSPGYVKDDFFTYLKEESIRRDDRSLIDNIKKIVLVKASNGHKYALEDIFTDPSIMKRLEDTKVAKEVMILQKFMRMMDTNPDKAYYGYNHVISAQKQLAIDSLLVTDELFRCSSSIKIRKQYIELVDNVRSNGGTVYIFSSMHISGQQLQQVSGVAAILRYPLPDLDELELQAEEYENNDNDNEQSDNDIDDYDNDNNDNNDNGYDSNDSDIDEEEENLARAKEDLEMMNFNVDEEIKNLQKINDEKDDMEIMALANAMADFHE